MFIKLSHHDIKCCIDALEDIPTVEYTEQERKTINKLKLIHIAQQLSAGIGPQAPVDTQDKESVNRQS